jgi:hypothetical protein
MNRITRREPPNNAIDADSEKRHSFFVWLFIPGRGEC